MKETALNFELVDLGSTKDGKRKVARFDEPIKEGNCFAEPSNDRKPITLPLQISVGGRAKLVKPSLKAS